VSYKLSCNTARRALAVTLKVPFVSATMAPELPLARNRVNASSITAFAVRPWRRAISFTCRYRAASNVVPTLRFMPVDPRNSGSPGDI